MKIIKATAGDSEAAFDIIRACSAHMAAQGIDQWDAIYPNAGTIANDIAAGDLYLAVGQDSFEGMIVINEAQSKEYAQVPWLYRDGKLLVIHRLAVAPEAHRKGIASALMDFAEDYGRRFGYMAIRLDAFVKNSASIALYKKRHYRVAGMTSFRKGQFHCFEKLVAEP